MGGSQGDRSYFRRLFKKQREQLRNDPKRIEAKKLLDLMGRYDRGNPGITVSEVLAREAAKL